jgi:hypothetical protein
MLVLLVVAFIQTGIAQTVPINTKTPEALALLQNLILLMVLLLHPLLLPNGKVIILQTIAFRWKV